MKMDVGSLEDIVLMGRVFVCGIVLGSALLGMAGALYIYDKYCDLKSQRNNYNQASRTT